MIDSKVQ